MGTLLSLTGPSGVGKTVMESELTRGNYTRLISFTTRYPRQGEEDGVSYHFVSRKDARTAIKAGETAQHVEFNDHIYGTYLRDLRTLAESDQSAVIVVEPNGVKNIRKVLRDLGLGLDPASDRGLRYFAVYLKADREVLYERMVERYLSDSAMDKETFMRRWRSLSRHEIDEWRTFTEYDLVLANNLWKEGFRNFKDLMRRMEEFSVEAK